MLDKIDSRAWFYAEPVLVCGEWTVEVQELIVREWCRGERESIEWYGWAKRSGEELNFVLDGSNSGQSALANPPSSTERADHSWLWRRALREHLYLKGQQRHTDVLIVPSLSVARVLANETSFDVTYLWPLTPRETPR